MCQRALAFLFTKKKKGLKERHRNTTQRSSISGRSFQIPTTIRARSSLRWNQKFHQFPTSVAGIQVLSRQPTASQSKLAGRGHCQLELKHEPRHFGVLSSSFLLCFGFVTFILLERKTYRETAIFHLLVYSRYGCKDQDWTQPEPGVAFHLGLLPW